eukprot:CAMPEP_0194479668 /NCGR_PEP_ID=MMETSP0253-20130528/2714_1 /TAXON_ID=2966 /ORGANISM="Noctiluca scintillans" /LENGTH=580 /DNA_ID=CAMNT_0039318933 /DNA_START=46 /DNA_END=1788 /DNA_ORIENTATION=-
MAFALRSSYGPLIFFTATLPFTVCLRFGFNEEGTPLVRAAWSIPQFHPSFFAAEHLFDFTGLLLSVDPYVRSWVLITVVVLAGFWGAFILMAIREFFQFLQILTTTIKGKASSPVADDISEYGREENDNDSDSRRWSVLSIMALTSYRFYTGLGTATWLPYLLAKEGENMWGGQQSLFMGIAKLIYSGTILLNPLFGIFGDVAAGSNQKVGRRVYIFGGMTLCGLGCFGCIISHIYDMSYTMLISVAVWRIGEAMNDVTTEALVPEMVPPSQYQQASSVKAALFFLGACCGYVLMFLLTRVDFVIFYFIYLGAMLFFTIPPLVILSQDAFLTGRRRCAEAPVGTGTTTWKHALWHAYVLPASYAGGFPRACLATFLFTLGMSPMFFQLLIVRDIVGISDPKAQQQISSTACLLFFVSSAVCTVLNAVCQSREQPRADRSRTFLRVIIGVSVASMLIPFTVTPPTIAWRVTFLEFVSCLYGGLFGIVYTRFQDLTWELLPSDARWANAMGFNTMMRNLGIGLGSFMSGLVLNFFVVNTGSDAVRYSVTGYFCVSVISSLILLAAAYVARCALGEDMTKDVK